MFNDTIEECLTYNQKGKILENYHFLKRDYWDKLLDGFGIDYTALTKERYFFMRDIIKCYRFYMEAK